METSYSHFPEYLKGLLPPAGILRDRSEMIALLITKLCRFEFVCPFYLVSSVLHRYALANSIGTPETKHSSTGYIELYQCNISCEEPFQL